MLIAKLITPNQRGIEKVIIKTLTYRPQCLTTIRSYRQLVPKLAKLPKGCLWHMPSAGKCLVSTNVSLFKLLIITNLSVH